MLGLTYLAEVWGELTLTAAIGQIWVLPFLVYLLVVNITKTNRWVVWSVMTLLLGYPNSMYFVDPSIRRRLNSLSTSDPSSLELA
jgi:hypothetical protein